MLVSRGFKCGSTCNRHCRTCGQLCPVANSGIAAVNISTEIRAILLLRISCYCHDIPEKVTEISLASLTATCWYFAAFPFFFPSASYLLWSLPSCLTSDPLSVKPHRHFHPNVLHLCLVSFPVQVYLVWVLVRWHFYNRPFFYVWFLLLLKWKTDFLGHVRQRFSENPSENLFFFFFLDLSLLFDIIFSVWHLFMWPYLLNNCT